MRFWNVACLFTMGILFSGGVFGKFVDVKTAERRTYTQKDLTQDLKQLENCIMKENPFYFSDRESLSQLFLTAYEKIEDGMTELDFYRLVNPMIVEVGCGHTNLSISEALVRNREKSAKFFPLKVTLVDNELYVLEDDTAKGISAGDKIKSINGKTSDEIIDTLMKNISHDSIIEAKPRYILSKHFNSRFYDFVDNSESFHVKLMRRDGSSNTADLQAKPRQEFNTTAWGLHFAEYQDSNYYESMIYEDYAVLTIHCFAPEKQNKFDDYINEFFLKLREQNISKLIIDLRGNYGGSPFMAKTLLSHLITEQTSYFNCDLPRLHNLLGFQKPISPAESPFDGDLVVLIDGACFSTTAHFCSLIKHHNLGTFVGSETGGTYVCTDSSKDTVLKSTRMRLHYSTLTYKVLGQGLSKNSGILPDLSISPSIENLLYNKDIAMERTLQILTEAKKD